MGSNLGRGTKIRPVIFFSSSSKSGVKKGGFNSGNLDFQLKNQGGNICNPNVLKKEETSKKRRRVPLTPQRERKEDDKKMENVNTAK